MERERRKQMFSLNSTLHHQHTGEKAAGAGTRMSTGVPFRKGNKAGGVNCHGVLFPARLLI